MPRCEIYDADFQWNQSCQTREPGCVFRSFSGTPSGKESNKAKIIASYSKLRKRTNICKPASGKASQTLRQHRTRGGARQRVSM